MLPHGILKAHRVSIADPASSKKRVLEQAARLLAEGAEGASAEDAAAALPEAPAVDESGTELPDEPTAEQVFERLLERERLGSTGLAGGVALPHARMPGLDQCRGAFLRLAEPVEFDALDGQPVDLVFALLVPEEANEEHLQLLAGLAGTFNDEHLRQRLRSADADADADEVMDILTRHSSPHAA